MRIWHKDLIRVLPRKQLLGQWRECCLIAKNIAEKGTPNHLLVNRIMEYPRSYFYSYGLYVYGELERRNYKADISNFTRWFKPNMIETFDISYIFDDWHNSRYLAQCFYNLQEKYDCGGISEEEWKLICERIKEKYDEYKSS